MFYNSLRVGIPSEDVEANLRSAFAQFPHYRLPVKVVPPMQTLQMFYLDPDDGRYNAEVIELYFEGGVLSRKEYHPD
jgi:hypothetical protein